MHCNLPRFVCDIPIAVEDKLFFGTEWVVITGILSSMCSEKFLILLRIICRGIKTICPMVLLRICHIMPNLPSCYIYSYIFLCNKPYY
jgi:hypothetical protein